MQSNDPQRKSLKHRLLSCVAVGVMASNAMAPVAMAAEDDGATVTPIKHVIIIIGENRTFDHIFATYKPVNKGETVLNLLSRKIVQADGTPGANYGEALQYKASDTTKYELAPAKTPYTVLPPALVGGPSTPAVCPLSASPPAHPASPPPISRLVKTLENGLADDYYQYLLTGGTGQTSKTPDKRISYDGQDASHLPPGPFQLTRRRSLRRLCGEPGASLLSDVAAARLRRRREPTTTTAGAAAPIFSPGLK